MTLAFVALGQENDTALLRKLGVRTLEKHLYVHAFERKTDTCLFFSQEFDTLMHSVRERTDMSCYGYANVTETERSFRTDTSWFQTTYSDGLPVTQTLIRMDRHGKPLYVKNWDLMENDSSTTWIEYFGNRGPLADSSHSLTIRGQDRMQEHTIVLFNEADQPIEVKRFDNEGMLLAEDSYTYGKNGQLASVSNVMHGERPYFMQTFYAYDQHGRVVSTSNSVNQRQEFFYQENGLLSNSFSYNPKGELEAEILYTYTYR